MKNSLKVLLAVLSFSFASVVLADNAPVTKEVVIAVNNVFVPAGFDSQTDAYVVLSGIFPNGCYQWSRSQVKDVTTFEHEITSVATVSQGMCIQVLIPFSRDVKLGKLATGKHNLKFLSNDGTYLEKNMVVE